MKHIYFTLIIFFFSLLILTSHVEAKRFNITIQGNTPIILDDAGILTDYEQIQILDFARANRDATGFQYVFIIATALHDYTTGRELEDIYNDIRLDINAPGTILFLINTDPENTFCELQGYGEAQYYIPHKTCDYINELLTQEVLLGNYFNAFSQLFEQFTLIEHGELDYLESVNNDSSKYVIGSLILFISLLCSLLLVFLIFIIGRRVGKPFHKSNTTALSEVEKVCAELGITFDNYDLV